MGQLEIFVKKVRLRQDKFENFSEKK